MALMNEPPEVGTGDAFEGLLAGRVPDLQLEFVVGPSDFDGAELNSDGWIDVGLELFLEKLHHQTGFPHVRVPDDYEFEEVVVVCHIINH